jgi:single-strand DNA-binding protein
MSNMAVLCATGYLGRDSELKFTGTGEPMLKFSVGVSTGWGEKKVTTWYNCVWFSKQAEKMAQYMLKGQPVAISGEPSLRNYTTDAGVKGSSLEVRVNSVSLISSRQDQQPAQPAKSQAAQDAENAFGGEASDDEESSNIPF